MGVSDRSSRGATACVRMSIGFEPAHPFGLMGIPFAPVTSRCGAIKSEIFAACHRNPYFFCKVTTNNKPKFSSFASNSVGKLAPGRPRIVLNIYMPHLSLQMSKEVNGPRRSNPLPYLPISAQPTTSAQLNATVVYSLQVRSNLFTERRTSSYLRQLGIPFTPVPESGDRNRQLR